MKSHSLCAIVLIFAVCSPVVEAQTQPKIPAMTIQEVIGKLTVATPDTVIGWERIVNCNDRIANPTTMLSAIAARKSDEIAKTISENTDYECRIGPGYLSIIPKDNGAKHEAALTKREVIYPDAVNVNSDTFLEMLKGVNEKAPAEFMASGEYLPHSAGGAVSFKAGSDKAYVVLNEIARQLKAREWMVSYMTLVDPKNGAVQVPIEVRPGLVVFISRPDLLSF